MRNVFACCSHRLNRTLQNVVCDSRRQSGFRERCKTSSPLLHAVPPSALHLSARDEGSEQHGEQAAAAAAAPRAARRRASSPDVLAPSTLAATRGAAPIPRALHYPRSLHEYVGGGSYGSVRERSRSLGLHFEREEAALLPLFRRCTRVLN